MGFHSVENVTQLWNCFLYIYTHLCTYLHLSVYLYVYIPVCSKWKKSLATTTRLWNNCPHICATLYGYLHLYIYFYIPIYVYLSRVHGENSWLRWHDSWINANIYTPISTCLYIYACLQYIFFFLMGTAALYRVQYIERIASPDDTTLESLPICIYSTTYLFTYFYVPVYPCNNIRKKKLQKCFCRIL